REATRTGTHAVCAATGRIEIALADEVFRIRIRLDPGRRPRSQESIACIDAGLLQDTSFLSQLILFRRDIISPPSSRAQSNPAVHGWVLFEEGFAWGRPF